jgi:hypothetical protein
LLLVCKTHKLQNSQFKVVHKPLNHWGKPGGGKALSMTFFANLSKSWRQLLSVGLFCCVGAAWSDPAVPAKNDSAKPESTQADAPKTADSAKTGSAKEVNAKNIKKPGNDSNRDKLKGNNPKGNALKTANLKGGEITPEIETQALEFAGKQHPELVGLISPLKTTNPKEYQRAVRELFRTSERLDNIRQREPARYELELEAWKLQSHVRLLAARLVMEPEPELQKSLKDAIRQKADNHVRLLQFEKESLKNRLEQIDRNIEKSSKSLDQTVDQEYERLLKQASRDKPVVQKQKKTKANPEVPKVESGVR